MSQQPEFAVMAEGKLPDLKRAQRLLAGSGIDAEIMQPPGGCGSG